MISFCDCHHHPMLQLCRVSSLTYTLPNQPARLTWGGIISYISYTPVIAYTFSQCILHLASCISYTPAIINQNLHLAHQTLYISHTTIPPHLQGGSLSYEMLYQSSLMLSVLCWTLSLKSDFHVQCAKLCDVFRFANYVLPEVNAWPPVNFLSPHVLHIFCKIFTLWLWSLQAFYLFCKISPLASGECLVCMTCVSLHITILQFIIHHSLFIIHHLSSFINWYFTSTTISVWWVSS